MDEGVIHLLKAIYRKDVVRKVIQCIEEENPSENFVAARNANVSLSLGCTIDTNNR